MRLLNVKTRRLRSFITETELKAVHYAALSHTWGEEEVTFQDFHQPDKDHLKGFDKIWRCCAQAEKDNIDWVWIDTCCIDKKDSTELSEAINSMYRWYQNCAMCYVFLDDVPPRGVKFPSLEFDSSRWFRRGWTLQELIAPKKVYFFAQNGSPLGSKWSLAERIKNITSIPVYVLQGGRVQNCCVARRMSWASNRETSKVEDTAYCLLGLFDVNMPLIYGEGHRAFQRLQQEILRQTEDLSFLLWIDTEHEIRQVGVSIFAQSPKYFRIDNRPQVNYAQQEQPPGYTQLTQYSRWPLAEDAFEAWKNRHPFQLTTRGLRMHMFVSPPRIHDYIEYVILWTEYQYNNRYACLYLGRLTGFSNSNTYYRYMPWKLVWRDSLELQDLTLREIYLSTDMMSVGSERWEEDVPYCTRHAALELAFACGTDHSFMYLGSSPTLKFQTRSISTDPAALTFSDQSIMSCHEVRAEDSRFMSDNGSIPDPVVLRIGLRSKGHRLSLVIHLWLYLDRPRCTVTVEPENHETALMREHGDKTADHLLHDRASDYAEVELWDGKGAVTVEVKLVGTGESGYFAVQVCSH